MHRVTLEQWRMLQAVVEAGGFAQAAERVHKSQSSIHTAVNKLQQQLGVPVLVVQGRKAELTEAGRLLLRRAGHLLAQAQALEEVAQSLGRGLEAEITLAVDEVFPHERLGEALEQFSRGFPHTRVQLRETVLSGGAELMLRGGVDVLVSGFVPGGLAGDHLLSTDFIAVAHPDHALHHLGRCLTLEDLQTWRQLVVRDSGRQDIDSGWLGAEQRWTVTHMATSVDMVCRGLGFAWLPLTRIHDHLRRGELKALPLGSGGKRQAALYLIQRDADASGPAAKALVQVLKAVVVDHCGDYLLNE